MILACLFHAELLISIGSTVAVLAYAGGMRRRRQTA